MHPATVANVEILRQRGANFIGPEKGMLACGYEGIGRLWPVDEIVAKALTHSTRASAKKRHHLPTRSQNGSRDAELKRVCGWLSAKVV
jgi:phosphopantothenoylcysteine synthetase/decarboxylase